MRKNVSGQRVGAQLVSATDGSAFTGTVTVRVTGDAGTQTLGATGSGVCTHEGNGYHTYAPSQAETNFDLIAFTFTGTGAVPVTLQIYTRMDANLTHVTNTAYGSSGLGVLASLESGSIDSGTFSPTSSQFYVSGLSLTGYSNAYKGSILKVTSGTCSGSFVAITASSWTGSYHDLSIYPSLPTTPSGGDSFVVIPGCTVADVYQWGGSPTSSANVRADVRQYGGTNGTFSGGRPEVNTVRLAGQTITASGGVTFPAATLASTTNITAGTITTVTNLTNAPTVGDLTATMKASINAEVDAAIETYHLDHLLAADYDPASKPGVSTALLNELVESDAGVSRFTANALEQAPTGGSAPTAAAIRAEIDANSTQLAAIVADTSELQTDLANGGRLDLLIDGIKAKTDNLPSDPADASDIASAFGAVNSTLSTIAGYVDTEVAAIKAKTDNLPASPAATGDIPSASAVASQVRTELSTELGRIDAAISTRLATAGYTAPDNASIAAILADTGTDGVVLSTATLNAIADALLLRNASNTEATAGEHTLTTVILALLESSRTGTTWTINRTNGSTVHATKTLTVDADADPITGVT